MRLDAILPQGNPIFKDSPSEKGYKLVPQASGYGVACVQLPLDVVDRGF